MPSRSTTSRTRSSGRARRVVVHSCDRHGLGGRTRLHTKHAVKEVDRLLSNPALDVWTLFAYWVQYVIGDQQAIVVALDWTDFDADGHATIALSVVTAHGCALPLVWRTVPKARLKGHRNRYEDELLLRLHETLPPGVAVTVLADRGFGDQQLYAVLRSFDFHFIVRFRGTVLVDHRGDVRPRTTGCWRTAQSVSCATSASPRTGLPSTPSSS
jgi:hypothetical protein